MFRDDSLLQRALEYVNRSLKCLTRRHDVTFLCGDTGPLAVAAVVYHRLQRVQETDECINRSVDNAFVARMSRISFHNIKRMLQATWYTKSTGYVL